MLETVLTVIFTFFGVILACLILAAGSLAFAAWIFPAKAPDEPQELSLVEAHRINRSIEQLAREGGE